MKPEDEVRKNVDKMLQRAGWIIQDYKNLNLGAGLGVAIREFSLASGFADYLLFVDRQAVGVIEAKKAGVTLSGVADQSMKYINAIPPEISHINPPPFVYETTGYETYFRDLRDPYPRSRQVFYFHQPQELLRLLNEGETLRKRLTKLPPLITRGLRKCQIDAITNLEKSLAEARPRALIQMATGSGKTYTAVSFIYRLIKFAKAKRILFLVDRKNLGRQTLTEFQQYITPDDGRKFTNLYNVQLLSSNKIDKVCKVTITTIQRLYSMLCGEEDFEEEIEEHSLYEISVGDEEVKEVSYNPEIPIETYDFIIVDECHRSIYNKWRQVLEYFDAFIIGLTATPASHTYAFFNQNLVMEYPHERAVADNVNVGYEVYQIRTKITENGSIIEAGHTITKRDKLTRQKRWEQLDEDFEYSSMQLDRSVVSIDQIRTIIKTLKEKLFTEIFPGRKEVPKTLIFAKNDSHAEDIVHVIREEFARGNEFCKKITYRSGTKPETLIKDFRTRYFPRIAVTVDMISTGTDIRPLECLVFMRDVKSRVYFEQMKGRGTRTINPDDLKSVTPDANYKTHFVIVDAVGVTEKDKTDSQPLERNPTIALDKLMLQIAMGQRDEDRISSLAGRIARLMKQLDFEEKEEIENIAGRTLSKMVNDLLDAIDPDIIIEKTREKFEAENPTEEQINETKRELLIEACAPFDSSDLRNKILDMKRKKEQVIDDISKDEIVALGFTTEQAQLIVQTFKEFLREKKDEVLALQIFYNKPYGRRKLTYAQVKQLAEEIKMPPYYLTTEKLWQAYKQLDQSKVKGAGPKKLLTNIISLVRYALEESDVLEPFEMTVEEKFQEWLEKQQKKGRKFTNEQMEWLIMIKNHIATSMSIEEEDFNNVPFYGKGGIYKAFKLFGEELKSIIEELNEVLAI